VKTQNERNPPSATSAGSQKGDGDNGLPRSLAWSQLDYEVDAALAALDYADAVAEEWSGVSEKDLERYESYDLDKREVTP
jgi:hypothetical protein